MARVFTSNPIVQRGSIMQMIALLLCVLPTAYSIIVKDPPPSPDDYKYSYDIQDSKTGDTKSQHEVRQGNIVTGAYTVLGPDGTKRTVEYTADDKHGFKAVISEEPSKPLLAITHPPLPYHLHVPSHGFNAVQYQSTLRPTYVYQDKAPYYFTPERQLAFQTPIQAGHYFVSANHKY